MWRAISRLEFTLPHHRQSDRNDHEIRFCRRDRVGWNNAGGNGCERRDVREHVTPLHGARRLFRGIAVCADRLLACQGDARDQAEKRSPILHDLARADAMAGFAAAARASISRMVRSRQSEHSASCFASARCIAVLSEQSAQTKPLCVERTPYMNILYFEPRAILVFQ